MKPAALAAANRDGWLLPACVLGALLGLLAVLLHPLQLLVLAAAAAAPAWLLIAGDRRLSTLRLVSWFILLLPLAGALLSAPGLGRVKDLPVFLLTGLLLVVWLGERGRIYLRPDLLTAALSAYLLGALLALWSAVDLPASVMLSAGLLIVIVAFCLIIPGAAWTAADLPRVLGFFSRAGLLLCAANVLLIAGGPVSVAGLTLGAYNRIYALPRAASIFANPNSFGLLLVFTTAATFMLIVLSEWRQQRDTSYYALWAALIFQGGSLLLTFSRSSYLALFIFFMIFCALTSRRRFILAAAAIIIVFTVLLLAAPDFLAGFLRVERFLAGRDRLWAEGLEVFCTYNPVLGIGLGGWGAVSEAGRSVHNTYLRLAVETGLVGLVAYLGLIAAFLGRLLGAYRYSLARGLRREAVLSAGILALFAGLAVQQFFETLLLGGTAYFNIYLLLLLSLGLVLTRLLERPRRSKKTNISRPDPVKRVIDIVLALLALLLTAPLLLAAALAVRLTSPGPVFFRQQRIGRGGRPFMILKLRTMVDGAARIGAGYKVTAGDARITPVGRLLRRTSIDELPQLFNVLKGEMSLVGPRPTLAYQVERYTPRQRRRLDAPPGMTGWAQLHGRNSLSWPERIELDIWYVEHRSLWLDLKILLLTLLTLLRARGIYRPEHSEGGGAAPAQGIQRREHQ